MSELCLMVLCLRNVEGVLGDVVKRVLEKVREVMAFVWLVQKVMTFVWMFL